MINLDKLEKLGWDSLSFRAYIVRPELEYVTEDVQTHINGMNLDSQYIKDFFMNIYVTNLDEDEKMQIGSVKGRFFLPMDFTRFGLTLYDVADYRGWDFGAMASAIIGKDGNIKPEVADEDDTIVYIEDFYINKQFRDCGIGSYIIDNIEDILYYYANTVINKIIVLPQPRVVNKSKELQNISEKNKKKDLIMKKLVSFYEKNGFKFIKNTKYMLKKIR